MTLSPFELIDDAAAGKDRQNRLSYPVSDRGKKRIAGIPQDLGLHG